MNKSEPIKHQHWTHFRDKRFTRISFGLASTQGNIHVGGMHIGGTQKVIRSEKMKTMEN